ncbi:MAG TPA: ice-binding family protein, partial [Thermoanaerobaculia bacterium]
MAFGHSIDVGRLVSVLGLAVCTAAPAALGQPAPSLGAAESFVILANTGVRSSGPTRVTGKIGVSPGTVSGFPPGILSFGPQAIETNERTIQRAQQDSAAAYDALAALPCDICHPGDADLSENVIFNGTRDAVWIVRVRGNLTVERNVSTILQGQALSSHIFWIV